MEEVNLQTKRHFYLKRDIGNDSSHEMVKTLVESLKPQHMPKTHRFRSDKEG